MKCEQATTRCDQRNCLTCRHHRAVKPESFLPMPCGLRKNDSIEDALKRADSLSGVDWHSGLMTANKDLRRIVLMAYEIRKLRHENR